MAKGFRPVRRDQQFLLPPDMASWLPEDHLAWFVISVVDELDVSEFEAGARLGGVGRAGYDPRMLLALLIYAYACGQRSSRHIERLCSGDVAFRVICAQDVPDHTTIARFRQRHERAVADLFAQVLRLCARAGLGRVGVVAIDGTKIAASASKDANRGEEWLRAEAVRIVAEADAVDAAEDELFGQDRRGDQMPREWTDPRTRQARIRAAVADLDAEAAAAAAERAAVERAQVQDYQDRAGDPARRRGLGRIPSGMDRVVIAEDRLDRALRRARTRVAERQAREAAAAARGTRLPGRCPVGVEDARVRRARAQLVAEIARRDAATTAPPAAPSGRRRNLTDPDSRLMPTRSGWVQGYNAQLAVSGDQVILAAELTQRPGDVECYQPMVTAAQAAARALAEHRAPQRVDPASIQVVLADAGYLSEHNLTVDGPDRLIAVGKRRALHRDARQAPAQGPAPADADPVQAMAHRLRIPDQLATYHRRGVTVEPVNGHLKDTIGLRRFARRGLSAAASELALAAAVANLLKIYRLGWAPG